MTGRRTILGLCILCALALSIITAQGAMAGQTAFTCSAIATGFSSPHCVPGETGSAYGHVEINEETHAKVSNEKTDANTTGTTPTTLKETLAATNVELTATGVQGLGTLKNEEVGGEMRGAGTSDANGITYTGVSVKAPAGKGCTVYEDELPGKVKGTAGVVKTTPLTAHTVATGSTHEVLIEPVTPGVLATFFLECTDPTVPAALKGTWEVTGKLSCPTHGATISCEHGLTTTQNTLKGKGAKAGLEGKTTVTAGKFPTSEPTNPVSVTTTTP